jgi:hypothetical protein
MVPQRAAVQCGNRCSRHQALVFVANGLAVQGENVNLSSTKKKNQPHWAELRKTFRMLTSRKDLSTAVHPTSAWSSDNTGSPSLRHASCATQAEGAWSRVNSVRLGLYKMQAMRWQATATEMLLPLCETRNENKIERKNDCYKITKTR